MGSSEACGRGSWAGMASVFQSLKDVGDDGWQLPTYWNMKGYTMALLWQDVAYLYWNWCSLLSGTIPSGATPSSGGM